jgi:hypothetical protein
LRTRGDFGRKSAGHKRTENVYGNLAAADHQRSGSGQHVRLVALGYTMVYGIINLINFAHGEVLMVGALTSWTIIGMMQDGHARRPGWVILIWPPW